MDKVRDDRRRFLAVGAGLAVAPMCVGCGGDDSNTPAQTRFDVAAVSAVAVGQRIANRDARVVLVRDAMGLFAFSMVCTHEGCIVEDPAATDGAIVCRCHNARFTGDGARVSGPATRNLPRHFVEVVGGRVFVDTARTVDDAARAAV